MADQKLLKVTNRSTGQVWMKTSEQVKALQGNKILAPRFIFEKEVAAPEMAPKISAAKVKAEPKPDVDIEPTT
jgi:hypothetical protein